MPTPTKRELVLARVYDACSYLSAPALTAQQVSDILDRHLIAAEYTASAVQYLPGKRVVPTVSNGRMYVSIANGQTTYTTAGALTDANWPIPSYGWPDLGSNTVTDGTVTWQDDGLEPPYLWDINGAARECLLLKAAMVAGCVDAADGDMSLKNSQQHAALIKQANMHKSLGVS